MSIKKTVNKKFSDLTVRPALFKNSYWGCFSVENSEIINDDIVKNRNELAEEFRIKTYVESKKPSLGGPLFDHCELYRCESGYIYVTSPYHDGYDEIAIEKGFTRYKKLYSSNATTYIQLFESKLEFNRFLKL